MEPSHIVILIVYITLIILSAMFSSSETAYSAANAVRLKTLEASGSKRAGKTLKYIENFDKLLSTLLVGNNIVNITAATLGTILFVGFLGSQNLGATISTIVTTVVLLIFGEVTPKSLAKERPETFAMAMYPFVKFFFVILTPINAIFMLWKKLIQKVFKLQRDQGLTDAELKTYVEAAEKDGGISVHERDLIRSAIEFEDLDIYDIMTPRVSVVAIEENESIDDIAEKFYEHGYSRLPVYSKSIDSIIGVIHEKDFFYMLRNNKSDIKEIIQSSISVSDSMKISDTLRLLQKAKLHMAIVVDEFGGTSGIVTMEDIIEELVGEIWDEHDEVEVLMRKEGENEFLVNGAESLQTLFEAVGIVTNEEFESVTVGGWVTEQMEKLPVTGEEFSFENLIITVTKASMKKVIEVRVKVNPKTEE